MARAATAEKTRNRDRDHDREKPRDHAKDKKQESIATPSREDFAAMLDESFQTRAPAEGSVITGHVVAIENDFAVIDVGLKTEGRIPLKEFGMPGMPVQVKIGDTVEVYLERIE